MKKSRSDADSADAESEETLVDSNDHTEATVTEEPRPAADVPASTSAPKADLPETIAGYRILRKLGAGGMGVVFEAEQSHPKRRVALKVIRGGQLVDDLQVRMFQREVETLARLKHPNIGAIYDAGHTDGGQHFFAMELVEGQDLGVYLGKRPTATERREIEQRLRLFRQICDAVQYAHQRGVIHRDLKPANIFVTSDETTGGGNDALPNVKILDFGLARITDTDMAAATILSEVGTIKGTLPYMSPEQARGDPEQIDLRSDVYALGVILYQMLVGTLPYDTHKSSLIEALRVICEESPTPLRAAWSGVRRVDPDLETIVGKALEKEADQRYASAAALSDDIERFLTSQPIQARPPSAAYQLKKLVARNKVPSAFAATVLVLLVGFGIWMSILYGRATRAEAQATREAETATQVSDFMVDLFEVSDPSEAQGNTITAREILDRGAGKIEQKLSDQPIVGARLLYTVGKVYTNLGLLEPSERLLEQSLELRERTLGPQDPEVAASLTELGWVQVRRGEWEAAERRLLRARQIRTDAFGAESLEVAGTLVTLGELYREQARWNEAEEIYRLLVAIQEKLLPADDPALAQTLERLARLLFEMGRSGEAEPMVDRSLAVREKILGPDHPNLLASLAGLAEASHDRGDFERAGTLLEELLTKRRRVLGPEHPETLQTLQTLADVNSHRGHYEEAEAGYRELLPIAERLYGSDQPPYAKHLFGLAHIRGDQGLYRDALAIYEQIQEIFQGALDPASASAWVSRVLGVRAQTHLRLDEPEIAESLLNRVDETTLGPNGLKWHLIFVGVLHTHRGEYADAEAAFQRSLSIQDHSHGHGDQHTLASQLYFMGILHRKMGRPEEANSEFERLRAVVDSPHGVDVEMLAQANYEQGLVFRDQGRLEEAEELLRKALSARQSFLKHNHPETQETLTALAAVLREMGRDAEAAELEGDFAKSPEVSP